MKEAQEQKLESAWQEITKLMPLTPIKNDKQYRRASAFVADLIDRIGSDEDHPLADLLDTVGALMDDYEEQHHSIPEGRGVDALRFLMDQHGLRQSDMTELGSQGVVSEILAGKRAFNLRQIKALTERFGVPPAVFL